jgi:Tol biopolymer transport system component
VSRKHLALALAGLVAVAVVAIVIARSEETDRIPTSDGERTAPSQQSEAPSQESEPPSFVPSGSSNIYVVDVATRSFDQLTKNDGQQIASHPAWSGSGKIAFSEAPSGDEEAKLFLIDPDGSNRKGIPTRVSQLLQPDWAPDGHRVAVVRFGTGIYVLDLRTGSTRRLKATSEIDDAPAWSPDGKTIVFQRQVTASNWDLYGISPTGSGLRRLTRDPLQQINPTWSPDGSRLAFSEQQKNGNWVVSSMRLDGSDRKLLTDQKLSSQDPSWSPDGEKIAFILQELSRSWIAVVAADGGEAERISPQSLVTPESPFWSPDSKKIAFASRHAARPPPDRGPGS